MAGIFSRSRKKIVLTMLTAMVLFLAATLAVIYFSSWWSVNRQNEDMLERYIGMYSLESPPGQGLPELPPDINGSVMEEQDGEDPPELPPDLAAMDESGAVYRLSSFYSAAFSGDGEVLAVDTGSSGLYSSDQIVESAREIMGDNRAAGKKSHLLYRVEQKEGYTLVAFMDMTVTDNSMQSVLLYTLAAGAAAICVLTLLSVWFARLIIEPLEENDRKQKQFISNAGHELKTPIAVINTNAELLGRQIGSNEWLDNIRYENRRMEELVSELLNLLRAEAAKSPKESLDLSQLTEREVLPFESVAFEEGLRLECHIEPGITVKGNSAQLCQLVSILVDNAIRYGKGGDQVEIELTQSKKKAFLKVSNHGDIPQDQMERLFDRFYRIDEARTDTGDGKGGNYGLGLSIAKAVAESHGGKISASCADGEVSFTVELPLIEK